jgi:hypothetical protein
MIEKGKEERKKIRNISMRQEKGKEYERTCKILKL